MVSISYHELFAILDREFHRLRPAECFKCLTPPPLRRPFSDSSSSNWYIATAPDCPHTCHILLTAIAERLQAEYALEASLAA